MMISTDNMISISEANKNFSKVARLVDQTGQAVILKKQCSPLSGDRIFPGRGRAAG